MTTSRLIRYVRDNGLTLAFLFLLLLALVGQAVSGVAEFNHQQTIDGAQQVSLSQYVTSSSFAVDVAENWQSEYLQFALYILATIWLVQRGSSESKSLEDVGTQSDKDQKVGRYATPSSPAWARVGGWRTALYGRSLGTVMAIFFLLSLTAQSIAGHAAYNVDLLHQHEDPVSWVGYATSADFWNRTLQNWQSEFLAVASMAAFAIYLRQRGSPESKLVGAAHNTTAQDS
jgi:Na+-transporting methylmalonyl-CoA/oxaloacetate decarboxylase gamma subunit